MSRGLVAGSFDPLTKGHLDLIKRATLIFDEVIVAVVDNREKNYLFSSDERSAIAQKACENLRNVSVYASNKMLIDICRELDTFAICKGVRNAEDLAYENLQHEWNHEHEPRIQTVYLPSKKEYEGLSSTKVRTQLEKHLPIDELVPESVVELIHEFYKG